ncbi:NAD(P)H-hydrate epimerase, partial [Streptomyces galilaeus]|uniref:NAD(P)H-hydrate epimerase n=2 Tax=Actinomycetes TaxID=1760 RepID=UPI0038F6ABBB
TRGPVLVLAGSGDNGGDALFAAAEFAASATRVDIVLTRDRVHREGLDAALAAGARIRDASDICAAVADHVLVVDGILGIGAS